MSETRPQIQPITFQAQRPSLIPWMVAIIAVLAALYLGNRTSPTGATVSRSVVGAITHPLHELIVVPYKAAEDRALAAPRSWVKQLFIWTGACTDSAGNVVGCS